MKKDYILAIIAVIGSIVLLLIIKKMGSGVLESIGVKDSKEDKENEKSIEIAESDAFNPRYNDTAPKTALLITAATGQSLSKRIKDAYGYVNDDEAAVYAVFKSLKTKSQVSALAYFFNKYYGLDLFNYIRGFLNDSEMLVVTKYVNGLPKYNV